MGACFVFLCRLAVLGFYTYKCMSVRAEHNKCCLGSFPRMSTWWVWFSVVSEDAAVPHWPCSRNKYYSSCHKDWLWSCVASVLTLLSGCCQRCGMILLTVSSLSVVVFLFLSVCLAGCHLLATCIWSLLLHWHCLVWLISTAMRWWGHLMLLLFFHTRPSNLLHLARTHSHTPRNRYSVALCNAVLSPHLMWVTQILSAFLCRCTNMYLLTCHGH